MERAYKRHEPRDQNTSDTADSQNFDEQDSETSHELLSLAQNKILPLLSLLYNLYREGTLIWKGVNKQGPRGVTFYYAIYTLGSMMIGLNADYGLLTSDTMGPAVRAVYDRAQARLKKYGPDAADMINSINPSYREVVLAFAVTVAAIFLYHMYGGKPFKQRERRTPLTNASQQPAANGPSHDAPVETVPSHVAPVKKVPSHVAPVKKVPSHVAPVETVQVTLNSGAEFCMRYKAFWKRLKVT